MSPEATRAPPRLHAQQTAFAAHLRDPDAAPAPDGIEERRLQVYRELFYNSIEGLLASNFPVIRALLGDTPWHALVRAFYREHRSHTPLFPQIGREFVQYLEQRGQAGTDDPPFLAELAQHEWVEVALALDETDLAAVPHRRDGDLLDGVPVPSPLAWPIAYRWPVHRIGAAFAPRTPPDAPTLLLVLRDRTDTVHFKQIDALAFALLQAMHDNSAGTPAVQRTGRELLDVLADSAGAGDRARFVAQGAALLEQLRVRDAVLGAV